MSRSSGLQTLSIRCVLVGVCLLASACATSSSSRLQSFERVLAAQDSATVALTQWCETRAISDPARIVAQPGGGAPVAADARTLRLLEVNSRTELAYRNVALDCGSTTLSRAHNWFVPERLTPAMNETLNTTREPFGRVVAPLGFTRERLPSERGAGQGCPADTVLSHSAVLKLSDGTPISRVIECYTPATIADSDQAP